MALLIGSAYNPFISFNFILWIQIFKQSLKFKSLERVLQTRDKNE